MSSSKRIASFKSLFAATFLTVLTGCGAAGAAKAVDSLTSGGSTTGSSSSSSGTSGGSTTGGSSANNAPVFATDATLSIIENRITVASISATDQEGSDISLSKVGGADSDLFNLLSNGALTFVTAPDYESPMDADTNNEYLVEIEADDGENETRRTFAVNVENLLEGYVVDGPLSNSTVFLDLNGDRQRDPGEPQTTTDAFGYFELKDDSQSCFAGLCDVTVIATGGTDTATTENVELSVYGQALGDSNFSITPLGTVLHESVNPVEIISQLNLVGSKAEILAKNPWAEGIQGTSQGQHLLKLNQQIGLLFETANTIAKSQDESLGGPDISRAVALAVADALGANAVITPTSTSQSGLRFPHVLTDNVWLKEVLGNALATLNSSETLEEEELEAVAKQMGDVNGTIASDDNDATGSTVLETVGKAQDNIQDSISKLIADLISVEQFIDESSQAPDTDGDGVINSADDDDDNDGVLDSDDAFPLDSTETLDTDSDGIGNNTDTDDDGDGTNDTSDAFPLDSTETLDTDSDGIGNNADTDDDGDGTNDTSDAFPLDSTEAIDTDSDGIGNNTDTDDDGDGTNDTSDAFPLDSTETIDTDSDGIGNNTDIDDDGDGTNDTSDAFPLDSTEAIDTDSDGIGNNTDTDDDGDGVLDVDDSAPLDASIGAGSGSGSGSSTSRDVIFVESFESPVLNATNFPLYNDKWVNYGEATAGYDTGSDAPVGTSFVGDSGLEWSVPLGNIDLVGSGNFAAADGTQSINLNGFEQGAIETSIFFPAAGSYTLVFALSKNPTEVDEATVEVTLDGVELTGSPVVFSDTVSSSSMNYRYVTIPFSVASAGSRALRFKSLNEGSPNGYGPVIDDLSISRDVIFVESFESPVLNATNFPLYNDKWVNYGEATAGYDTGSDAPVGTSFVGDSGLEWSVPLGNIDLVGSGNFAAADGTQSINLNGFEQGAIETSIFFPAAGSYTLVFALSKNPTEVDEATVEVTLDGVELTGSPVVFSDTVSSSSMNYRYVTIPFSVASAGSRALRFKSLNEGSPNGYGPVIDDLSISRDVIFVESFESPVLNATNFPLYNDKWVNYGEATAGYDTGSDAPVGTSFVGDSGLEWSVPLGNIDLVGSGNFAAADGTQSINLNGFEQGAIETSIFFPAAGSYTLVFALSKNPTEVDEATVEVTLDGVELTGSPVVFSDTVSSSSMNYRYVTIPFSVASAGSRALRFKSLNEGSPNGYGPVIDDLSISLD